jgi:hypothetical protein
MAVAWRVQLNIGSSPFLCPLFSVLCFVSVQLCAWFSTRRRSAPSQKTHNLRTGNLIVPNNTFGLVYASNEIAFAGIRGGKFCHLKYIDVRAKPWPVRSCCLQHSSIAISLWVGSLLLVRSGLYTCALVQVGRSRRLQGKLWPRGFDHTVFEWHPETQRYSRNDLH